MDYPSLQPGQYALIHAEVTTGTVTFADGQRYLGSGDPWLLFNSFKEAQIYAKRKIMESPELECSIIDASHQQIERCWNQAHWQSGEKNPVHL